MATKNVVPRADNEGNLGVPAKKWAGVYAKKLVGDTLESPTITNIQTSITNLTNTVNSKAPQTSLTALTNTVNTKADKSYVDSQINATVGKIPNVPFELDANGDLMPKA